MKVVISNRHGGFGLSPKALLRLWELGYRDNAMLVEEYFGNSLDDDGSFGYKSAVEQWKEYLETGKAETFFLRVFNPDMTHILGARTDDPGRSNPLLIQVIEELGKEAAGPYADLSIVEIPDDVEWHIAEYDGCEWVAENHRTWH